MYENGRKEFKDNLFDTQRLLLQAKISTGRDLSRLIYKI